MILSTVVTNDLFYEEDAEWLVRDLIGLMTKGSEYCFFFGNDIELDSREIVIFQLPYSSFEPIMEKMHLDLTEYERTADLKHRGIQITTYKRKAD